ncbi:tetratricopeptide repeat protein [Halomarina halobia]|uniref:Tetratricopeptide repeat protein n=1 Tax=Halomarina halobia TaxID=3033386 RepID=A0ABD6A7R9_9EURY|nr:tetratricopeptide repeat protein [Halomarina sp. PSR21]
MADSNADDEFVRLLRRRGDFLDHLRGEPRRKRDLVEALDCSRSTVDRALRELEYAGLVERTGGGYEASVAGRLAAEAYGDLLETVGVVLGSSDLLASLPNDCDVGPDALVGGERVPLDTVTPYELPPMLRECVESARRLTAVVPVVADPRLLGGCQERVADGSLALDLVVGPDLHETLCRRFPDTLRELADGGATIARAERAPPCTLLVVERRDGTRAVACVTYDGDARDGVYRNDADAALDWATDYVERVRDAATDVTDDARSLAPGARRLAAFDDGSARSPRDDRRVLEREGFVELTDEYFAARSPASPTTSWRTGLDLAEVAAGYAADRTYTRDGERRSLADDLLSDLRSGGDRALVGPPGSGKSTVCKTVAYRWFEAGDGPVLYRKRGTGEAFASIDALRAYLRGTDGRALVVVEDALREEAAAVFGVMAEYRDDPSVTFLVDAREREWEDPSALPPDARVAAYRNEAIERVRMPGFAAAECERFVRHFEATTGRRVDLAVDDLLSGLDGSGQGDPADLLVVLHRLALSVDPLASYGSATPTTLTEDVSRTYERLREAGERALDVGALVNLLNAADVGVYPDLVHALAEDDHDAIADAIALLDGRVVFERDGEDGGDAPYRSVHESWSALFLRHLADREGERAAERRFGRVVTALLSLADDETRRARIEWEFHGAAPAIKDVSADPGGWADATVERVFALGLSRPGLAPLYGSSAYSRIDLPAACSPELAVRCTQWRGEMSLRAGRLDDAEREFEYLASLADGLDDDVEAATLHARSLKFRGTVALRRSEFDEAESFYERGLAGYRALGDEQGEADAINNLGIVAWSRGDLGEAEAYLRDCLERYRAMDDRRAEADAQFNLATILDSLGDLDAAADHYRSCLDHYRAAGDRRTEADTLNNLGNLRRTRGDLDASERSLTQALDTYRDIGDRLGEANCLHNLGHVAQLRGEYDGAVEYHERGLDAYREVGDTQGIAHCLNKLGDVDRRRGDLASAESYYRRSLEHRRDIGDGIGEAQSLLNLGRVAHRRGDDETAAEYAERGLERYRESGEVRGEAEALRLLGRLARERGAFETARERLRSALTRCRDSGHRYGEARTLVELGLLAADRGGYDVARERHEAALAAFTAIGAVPDVVETHLHLAAALVELGDPSAALAQCEEAVTLAEHDGLDASEAIARRDRLVLRVRRDG